MRAALGVAAWVHAANARVSVPDGIIPAVRLTGRAERNKGVHDEQQKEPRTVTPHTRE